jgi:hemin uptake protein HemP
MKEGEKSNRPDVSAHRELRADGEPREIPSQELLHESSTVRIRHRGEVYTLRQTSSGKLILTK